VVSSSQFDIVIVGGGVGGLALAAELAAPEFSNLRVVVLEKRTSYFRDRTFSFWRFDEPHWTDALIVRQWTRWRVASGLGDNDNCVVSHTEHPYCTIFCDAYYTEARARIAQCSHVQLLTGIEVTALDADGTVHTNSGVFTAPRVFDARPHTAAPSAFVQHFVGWEIEAQEDIFDDTTVDLMEFLPTLNAVHFFYVLPISKRYALVETTWLGTLPTAPTYSTELHNYIAARWPAVRFVTRYEERGVLDLTVRAPATRQGCVVPLGARGGTLRASTGVSRARLRLGIHSRARFSALRLIAGWTGCSFRSFPISPPSHRHFSCACSRGYRPRCCCGL
jgi:lycopene beta-cyclase